MTSAKKRLDAVPRLFPENIAYLDELRGNIDDTRSGSWRRLSDRMPDSTLSFDGATYGFPGFIIEVVDSQNWERNEGVKNKAVQYEDDSEGMIAGVLYLGYGYRSIGMIGSRSIFPSCPPVKYLDGTLSTHAVEVIPLTSLTNPAYSECLLLLKFAYFGAGQVLLRSLEPEEQEMGFFFTFKEILQMMEMVDKKVPSSPRPVDAAEKYDPLERQKPWNSVTTIRASLFTTPPDSLPYCPAQAYEEDSVEDSSLDEGLNEENSSPSD
jgi:hypothetical protein